MPPGSRRARRRRGRRQRPRRACSLALAPERERDPVEQRRIDSREHVGLVLGRIAAAGDQPQAVPLHDPGVVAGPEHVATGPLGEGDEGVEAKLPVAAHARVRRQAPRVAVDERRHDRGAERLAEIERDVRQPEPVAGLAGGDHRVGGAAGALGARAGRVEPEAQRDTDRIRRRAQERDCAVDAAAHRHRDPPGLARRSERRRNRVRERIRCERLTWHGGGLEQRQPLKWASEPRRIGFDDPIAVDDQTHERIRVAAGGVSDQLLRGHHPRLPTGPARYTQSTGNGTRGPVRHVDRTGSSSPKSRPSMCTALARTGHTTGTNPAHICRYRVIRARGCPWGWLERPSWCNAAGPGGSRVPATGTRERS